MALKKSKSFPNGFSGEYWKIIKTELFFKTPSVAVYLGLYKDKTLRDLNPEGTIEVQVFNFPWDEAFNGAVDIRAVCYSKIKESTEFSDAEDI